MKSWILAAAFLALTVADVIALHVVRLSLELFFVYELHFVLVVLTVIFATISAFASPRATSTRAIFCGLTLLFGWFGLLVAPLFLIDYDLVRRDDVSYWIAICMAGIAMLNVLPNALVRRSALVYGTYGLVIALALADLYVTLLVTDRVFLITFPPPDGDLQNGAVAPAQ